MRRLKAWLGAEPTKGEVTHHTFASAAKAEIMTLPRGPDQCLLGGSDPGRIGHTGVGIEELRGRIKRVHDLEPLASLWQQLHRRVGCHALRVR